MLRPDQVPAESIQLNDYTFIANARKYYQSNLEVWEANHGKVKFIPYRNRCIELIAFLKSNDLKKI
jgi:hypothetical protein